MSWDDSARPGGNRALQRPRLLWDKAGVWIRIVNAGKSVVHQMEMKNLSTRGHSSDISSLGWRVMLWDCWKLWSSRVWRTQAVRQKEREKQAPC